MSKRFIYAAVYLMVIMMGHAPLSGDHFECYDRYDILKDRAVSRVLSFFPEMDIECVQCDAFHSGMTARYAPLDKDSIIKDVDRRKAGRKDVEIKDRNDDDGNTLTLIFKVEDRDFSLSIFVIFFFSENHQLKFVGTGASGPQPLMEDDPPRHF